jgi:hypothetical protein
MRAAQENRLTEQPSRPNARRRAGSRRDASPRTKPADARSTLASAPPASASVSTGRPAVLRRRTVTEPVGRRETASAAQNPTHTPDPTPACETGCNARPRRRRGKRSRRDTADRSEPSTPHASAGRSAAARPRRTRSPGAPGSSLRSRASPLPPLATASVPPGVAAARVVRPARRRPAQPEAVAPASSGSQNTCAALPPRRTPQPARPPAGAAPAYEPPTDQGRPGRRARRRAPRSSATRPPPLRALRATSPRTHGRSRAVSPDTPLRPRRAPLPPS